ncbi:MAG: TonB-dependent receptor [Gemmatimonadota bacterium]
MSALATLILTLGIVAPDAGPGPGWIRGVVQTDRGEPLTGAVVSVVGVDPELTASADAEGRYRLRDVPAGRHAVRVEALGYASLEVAVRVPADAGVDLDFTLELRPVLLPPVDVNASPRPTDVDTASGPLEPEVRLAGPAVNRTVAAAPGLIDVGFGRVPGRSGEPVEPTDALFVRGAAAELKRVLLDGAPVHSPYNVAGLLPPFATGTVADGRLYLGGAPARYDGGLAYVLDLRTRGTRPAGPVHTEGALDMLAGRMSVDVSAGRDAGAWFSARMLHPWTVAGVGGGALPYDYADFVGHAEVGVGETGRIQATAFRNEEAVALASGAGAAADWGNDAGSVRLQGEVAGATAEVTAGWGRFTAHLPVEATGFAEDAVSDHGRLVAEVRHGGAGSARWSWGTSVERIHIRSGPVATDSPSDEAAGAHEVAGNAVGAYVESDWRPQPRLRVRTGLRFDHYTGRGGLRISPRVALTSLLGDDIALTLAVGRYRQFVPVRQQAKESPIVRRHLGTAHATHFVARMEQAPTTGVRLGVEGYFKRFGGTGLEPPWARATASGVDLWLGLDRDRWSGWAGYSLEWTWAAPDREQPATDRFVGRHLLSGGLAAPLGDAAKLRVRIGYGAGLPYTAISTPEDGQGEVVTSESHSDGDGGVRTLDSPYDAAAWIAPRSEPYLRLDAEASHDLHIAWGGRRTMLSPYIRVLNALGDRDGVFFRSSPDGEPDRLDPVDRYPVIPILGLRWRF